tara:strand:- start:262 stop:585 length:324 start_codon:yes stop_codon:yes gene_type:complete
MPQNKDTRHGFGDINLNQSYFEHMLYEHGNWEAEDFGECTEEQEKLEKFFYEMTEIYFTLFIQRFLNNRCCHQRMIEAGVFGYFIEDFCETCPNWVELRDKLYTKMD